MIQPWQTLASQMVLDHRWCRVRQDTVALPNGSVIDDFFVNVRPDVALVVPITADREIVFVRQYRHGVQAILLELPAGGFDPATEAPETAALRELVEETGYTTDHLIRLATLHDNPVKDTNRIHLFLAEPVIATTTQNLDCTEDIEVVRLPIGAVFRKIQQGEICVAGTIAAIFLALAQMDRSLHQP